MSSSLLEVAVIEAARRQGDEVEIEAISVPQVAVFDFAAHRPDIVLIGPQVRYKERSVRQLAEPLGVVVEVIDPVTYGMVDGDRIYQQIVQALMGRREEDRP